MRPSSVHSFTRTTGSRRTERLTTRPRRLRALGSPRSSASFSAGSTTPSPRRRVTSFASRIPSSRADRRRTAVAVRPRTVMAARLAAAKTTTGPTTDTGCRLPDAAPRLRRGRESRTRAMPALWLPASLPLARAGRRGLPRGRRRRGRGSDRRRPPEDDLLAEGPEAGGDPVEGQARGEAGHYADEQQGEGERQAALAALERASGDRARDDLRDQVGEEQRRQHGAVGLLGQVRDEEKARVAEQPVLHVVAHQVVERDEDRDLDEQRCERRQRVDPVLAVVVRRLPLQPLFVVPRALLDSLQLGHVPAQLALG